LLLGRKSEYHVSHDVYRSYWSSTLYPARPVGIRQPMILELPSPKATLPPMTPLRSAQNLLRLARKVTRGMLSYVPGVDGFLIKRRAGGGTGSPRYCYSIWLRHLAMAQRHGLSTAPATVAELGPGDSVGVGLAALLTGSERYWALDVLSYTNARRNLDIFDGLIDLVRNRTPIPNGNELGEVQPTLDSYAFPADI